MNHTDSDLDLNTTFFPLKLIFIFNFYILIGSFVAEPLQAQNFIKDKNFILLDSGRLFQDAPFKNCHAVNILETGKDTLLYVWFGGDYEGASNVKIWGRFRYLQSQNPFGKIFVLAEAKDSSSPIACWNPVLFQTKHGDIFLDYKVGPNPREWWAERKISSDHGQTWSNASPLPKGFLGPIKNKPIQLKNGNILYPSSTESKDDQSWKIHLEYSDSNCLHWGKTEIIHLQNEAIQPSIISFNDDSLWMLSRSKQNKIMINRSVDMGKSWTPMQATELPNPNSGIDAIRLKNGTIMLVYNPLQAGQNWWEGRSVLDVAILKPGKKWETILQPEHHHSGEYSYPSIIQSSDGTIHIAYTENRVFIKYLDIKLKEIQE